MAAAVLIVTSHARSDDQEASEILQRAIVAVGGEAALDRLKSPMTWTERGTYHGMGEAQPFVAQFAAAWPDWHRFEFEGAFSVTANGENVWHSSETGVRELDGDPLQEQLTQTRVEWAARLFPLTDEAYALSTIDGIDVDGRATVGIQASHADGHVIKLYFDNESCRRIIWKSDAQLLAT